MNGFVPVWRKLFRRTHWLSPSRKDPASRLHAWIDLVQLAQNGEYNHAGVDLGTGEFVASQKWLADRWCWSQSKVRRFMDRLRTDTMIDTVTDTPIGTVYRVVNYETYAIARQGDRHRDRHPIRHRTDTLPTPEQTQNTKHNQQVSPREAEVFNELVSRFGGGNLWAAEKAFYEHVPEHITADDMLKARQKYCESLSDQRYRKALGAWISGREYADDRWRPETEDEFRARMGVV